LFPATPEEQLQATLPRNDLAPHAPIVTRKPTGASSSSAWRRAGDTLSHWWQSLRGAAATPAGTAPAPDSTPSGNASPHSAP
jgi:hypothetical protein